MIRPSSWTSFLCRRPPRTAPSVEVARQATSGAVEGARSQAVLERGVATPTTASRKGVLNAPVAGAITGWRGSRSLRHERAIIGLATFSFVACSPAVPPVVGFVVSGGFRFRQLDRLPRTSAVPPSASGSDDTKCPFAPCGLPSGMIGDLDRQHDPHVARMMRARIVANRSIRPDRMRASSGASPRHRRGRVTNWKGSSRRRLRAPLRVVTERWSPSRRQACLDRPPRGMTAPRPRGEW